MSRGWKTIAFDDSDWYSARVLWRIFGWPMPQKNDRPTHLTPPWTTLVEFDIPDQSRLLPTNAPNEYHTLLTACAVPKVIRDIL